MDCRWGYLSNRRYQHQVRHGPPGQPGHTTHATTTGMVNVTPPPAHSCHRQQQQQQAQTMIGPHHRHHHHHRHGHNPAHRSKELHYSNMMHNTSSGAIRFRELRRAHNNFNRANSYGIYRRQGYSRTGSKMVSMAGLA